MSVPAKISERYECREVLGEGGQAVVYRAFDRVVRRDVAVKTIRDVRDKAAFELFRKECSILATFTHPHIVEIYDFGEFEDASGKKPFYVMPLLSGLPLDKLIHSASEMLPLERVVDIVSQVCRGLQAAHDRGLIHRDLKPSNIYILAGDSVKIIDFGVAHLVDAQSTIGLKGTLLYMAPEQVLMKKPSPLTDLFSLGVVCFEMLTRRRPYEGNTKEDIVEQIVKTIPPPASQFNTAIPLAVSQVIHKAMAKQPYHRFGSVKEFSDCLAKATRNEPIEIFRPERIEPRVQRAKKAYEQGELEFASEIVTELEAEALLHPEISKLRVQIEDAARTKTIQQLLDTARRRFEESEYQIALQKIQEVLTLDPSNTDAHALRGDVENKRAASQIEDWFKLAWQHMENHAYGQARKALQNVLQVRPKEQKAQQLLAEVDRREQDYLKLRREKEEAYRAAEDAYHRGELSSALTKLERVLEMDQRAPDTFAPDRAAIYQKMYNEVRSEHDRMTNLFSEVRTNFENGNLAVALAMCKEALEKYPGHAMFQSLKLDIEVRQRQELSAFIARVDREVDAEPDLNNRIRILEKAQQQYPEEIHFRQSLQTVKSKRDLVETIVNAARSLEERGQFSEAIDKWEILQNIYPLYPGLEFEVERVRKRRQGKERQEVKSRWLDQIDRARQAGDFERALSLCQDASLEFPGDAELAASEKAVRQRMERAAEAQRLVAEAKVAIAAGNSGEGLAMLRRANELDPASTAARSALLETLIAEARASVDSDWKRSDDLLQQALDLDPGNPIVNSLRHLVNDKMEDEAVTRLLSEARELEGGGDLKRAVSVLDEALLRYPNNTRLNQLRASLRRRLPEPQREEIRRKDLDQLKAWEKDLQKEPAGLTSIFQRTVALADDYAGDQEFEEVATRIAGKAPPEAPTVAAAVPPAPKPAPRARAILAASAASARDRLRAGLQVVNVSLRSVGQGRLGLPLGAGLVIVALLGFAAVYKATHKSRPDPSKTPTTGQLSVKVDPADARYSVWDQNGTEVTDSVAALKPGKYMIRAARQGYEPREVPVDVRPPNPTQIPLVLNPILAALAVDTEREGSGVTVDGQAVADSGKGHFVVDRLAESEHVVEVTVQSMKVTLKFRPDRARLPEITGFEGPAAAKAVAVAEFNGAAHVWRPAATPDVVQVAFDDATLELLGPTGERRSDFDPALSHVLHWKMANATRDFPVNPGKGPQVLLFLPGNDYGYLIVDAGVPDIKVFLDGRERNTSKWHGTGRLLQVPPGEYAVRVEAPGYDPWEEKATVVKNQQTVKKPSLKALVQFATLQVKGGKEFVVSVGGEPGVPIRIDPYMQNGIQPGRRSVHVTRSGYDSWTGEEEFVAGKTITLDIAKLGIKEKVPPTVVTFKPQVPEATLKLVDQSTGYDVNFTGKSVPLPKGKYTIVAKAPGYKDATEVFPVAERQPAFVFEIPMTKIAAPAPPPVKPSAVSILDGWDSKDQWAKQADNSYSRKSDAPTFFRSGAGVFELVTPRPKGLTFRDWRIRIIVGYIDRNNYTAFDLRGKTVERRVYVNGKAGPESKKQHEQDLPETLDIRTTVKPASASLEIRVEGSWITVGSYDDPTGDLTKGKFGMQHVEKLIDFKHRGN